MTMMPQITPYHYQQQERVPPNSPATSLEASERAVEAFDTARLKLILSGEVMRLEGNLATARAFGDKEAEYVFGCQLALVRQIVSRVEGK
jgi:hypothetical protein